MFKIFQGRNKPTDTDPPPPYSSLIPPVTSIAGSPMEPQLSLNLSQDNSTLHIKIQPTPGTTRSSVDICCVVDISGSMSEMATFKNDTGATESDGLTILDLVKHALKTVLSTMTCQDVLSIVSFSSEARLELPPTPITTENRVLVTGVIDALQTEGSTNLWGGLELGWETIRLLSLEGRIGSLFLFTDGMPNIIPPRGHLPMIRQYLDKHGLPCTVNTFGFGYSLESDLLDEIARVTSGSFVFIPDSSFVGTAFINATANLYTLMGVNAKLRLMTQAPQSLTVGGGFQVTESSWGKEIAVGNVYFDQSRDFVVELGNNGERLVVFLDYDVPSTGKKIREQEGQLVKLEEGQESTSNWEIGHHKFRTQFVDTIEKLLKSSPTDGIDLDALTRSIPTSASSNPPTSDLLKDIQGQVKESLDPKYYSRWGRHYLYSLLGGHRAQLCNNFKDPGVQHYGGPLFRALRDNFDEIFNALPPPKPTLRRTRQGPVLMHAYNNSRGPCFHGDCLVELKDGGSKKVRDVRPGDFLATFNSRFAKVTHVLETRMAEGEAELVIFPNGLKITTFHPIFDGESKVWKFPGDMYKPEMTPCDAVFSFAMEEVHSVFVNGVGVATLGHGATGDVREHPYFGTKLVINDLKHCGGGKNGVIVCKGIIRNPSTGLISGMELEPGN